MRITVTLPIDGRENHDGEWIDASVSDPGELTVTIMDRQGSVLEWTTYARGEWRKVAVTERPDQDVVAHRRQLAERMRNSNGGNAYGSNAGTL